MIIRLILFSLFFIFGINSILAHKPNQAFFNIQETAQGIKVEAEFPWTLRNALIKFNPALEEAKHKSEFENTFFEYLKENLILKNSAKKAFVLKSVKELPRNGHSHQNSYLIEYEGSKLFSIENTLSFSIFDNQKNFHKVISNNLQYEYKTSKETPIFTVGAPSNIVNRFPWKHWLGLITGGITIMLLGRLVVKIF